jgi:hypothetical protein
MALRKLAMLEKSISSIDNGLIEINADAAKKLL